MASAIFQRVMDVEYRRFRYSWAFFTMAPVYAGRGDRPAAKERMKAYSSS
jgi:hypothetical protein